MGPVKDAFRTVADGHKALVFSQWTAFLDLIEPELAAAEVPFVRLDGSTRDRQGVVEAFQKLPDDLNATLLLIGDGPLREQFVELGKTRRIVAPGYVRDRGLVARWLASSDIYVSGMADETFGISIVEAQASGLPVVGVAAGAMIDRVSDAMGRLGPVDDSDAMAANILDVWHGDRAAMGRAASEHAHQFSWDNSMDLLFRRIYPAAFARAATREGGDGAGAVAKPASAAAERS